MPPYSSRIYAPAAQGVEMWYRRLAGRTFLFTLVRAGWWGVGETGRFCVKEQIRGYEGISDWYVSRTIQLDPERLPPPASPWYPR